MNATTAKEISLEEFEQNKIKAKMNAPGPKAIMMSEEEFQAAKKTAEKQKELDFELTPEEQVTTVTDFQSLPEGSFSLSENKPLTMQQQAEQNLNTFTESAKESIVSRVSQLEDIRKEQGEYSDGLTLSSQIVGLAGATAGLGWDLSGDVFKLAADGYSLVIPDEIEESAKQSLKDALNFFVNTPIGKEAQNALEKGVEAWVSFKKENPEEALVVESVFNVGGFFRKGPNASPKVGDQKSNFTDFKKYDPESRKISNLTALEKGIWRSISAPKSNVEINKQTTTPQGVSGKQEVLLSPQEIDRIAAVKRYARVDPSRSDRQNANSISEAISKLDKRLKSFLSDSKIKVSHSSVVADITKRLENLIEANPGLNVKILQQQSQQAINQVQKILSSKGNSPLDILEARREVDAWLKKNYGEDFLKAREGKSGAKARNLIYEQVRAAMNQALNVDGSKTATALLKDQSHLLSALDAINLRIPQGYTTMARIRDNLGALNIQLPTTPLAQAATAQAVVSPKFLPFIGGMLVAATGAGVAKQVFSKAYYQKELRLILEALGEGIKTATNPEMAKQLRLDRAAIIEVYKGYMEDAEEEDKQNKEDKLNLSPMGGSF